MIKAAAYNCTVLQDPVMFKEVYNLISDERKAHVDEAKIMKAKCERLGASHLLEKLLWESHVQRPYEYGKTSQGKPILNKPEGIFFSISHSNYIAVAVVADFPVGIDIEIVRKYDERIVERFFTKNDYEYIKALDKEIQPKKFTEMWTFKEALAKMMDRPLTQILPWIDYHEYCDGYKGDMSWMRQGFEFRNFYITLCYDHERVPLSMGFYEPTEGKYY